MRTWKRHPVFRLIQCGYKLRNNRTCFFVFLNAGLVMIVHKKKCSKQCSKIKDCKKSVFGWHARFVNFEIEAHCHYLDSPHQWFGDKSLFPFSFICTDSRTLLRWRHTVIFVCFSVISTFFFFLNYLVWLHSWACASVLGICFCWHTICHLIQQNGIYGRIFFALP